MRLRPRRASVPRPAARVRLAGAYGNRTHPTRRRQVASVLKTEPFTRMRTLPHFADLHGTVDTAEIPGQLLQRDSDQQSTRGLGIHEEGALFTRDTPPVHERFQIEIVSRGAARERAGGQRRTRARQERDSRHVDVQGDLAFWPDWR